MAIAKPTMRRATSCGRTADPIAAPINDQDVTALYSSEYSGDSEGGEAETEGHHGFLAGVGGPEEQGRQEEDQVRVASPVRRSGT